jgi:hypothetical protein
MDPSKCYKRRSTGQYLGKFVKTVEYYPDGPGRGGHTDHFFEKDGLQYITNGSYDDTNRFEVTPCVRDRPLGPFAIIKIPKGQMDVVTMEEIKDGTLMVDFHDEREKYHRYYTEDTYRKLNNNKNPFNDRVIENADVKYYIAELDASLPVQEAGRRKRTRRNKTIRMKKSDYLREHHHLFKVLSRPTRRVLARELKVQKKELKERGFKG